MPLLNYTTTVEASRTVMEIQHILSSHGARAILINYGDQGQVESLSFQVMTPAGLVGFRLPINPEAIMKVLTRQRVRGRATEKPQAVRIAWRIVKDWVEAQMALLETEMVSLDQLFLPYAVTPQGNTFYEALAARGFKMLGPGTEEEGEPTSGATSNG